MSADDRAQVTFAPPPSPNESDSTSLGSSVSSNIPKSDMRRALSAVSACYDRDGKGYLTEAEKEMRERDTDNQGYLTTDQMLYVVQEKQKSEKRNTELKRGLVALVIIVILLVASNLGTAYLAIALSKDTMPDPVTGTLFTTHGQHIVSTKGLGYTVALDAAKDDNDSTYSCMSIVQLSTLWKEVMSGTNVNMVQMQRMVTELNPEGDPHIKGFNLASDGAEADDTKVCFRSAHSNSAMCASFYDGNGRCGYEGRRLQQGHFNRKAFHQLISGTDGSVVSHMRRRLETANCDDPKNFFACFPPPPFVSTYVARDFIGEVEVLPQVVVHTDYVLDPSDNSYKKVGSTHAGPSAAETSFVTDAEGETIETARAEKTTVAPAVEVPGKSTTHPWSKATPSSKATKYFSIGQTTEYTMFKSNTPTYIPPQTTEETTPKSIEALTSKAEAFSNITTQSLNASGVVETTEPPSQKEKLRQKAADIMVSTGQKPTALNPTTNTTPFDVDESAFPPLENMHHELAMTGGTDIQVQPSEIDDDKETREKHDLDTIPSKRPNATREPTSLFEGVLQTFPP